jgi:hypothetical protein
MDKKIKIIVPVKSYEEIIERYGSVIVPERMFKSIVDQKLFKKERKQGKILRNKKLKSLNKDFSIKSA